MLVYREGQQEEQKSKQAGNGKTGKKKSKGWGSDDSDEDDNGAVHGPQLTDIMQIMEKQQR